MFHHDIDGRSPIMYLCWNPYNLKMALRNVPELLQHLGELKLWDAKMAINLLIDGALYINFNIPLL